MTLDDYLARDDALSVSELAVAIGCDPAQIRQWKANAHGNRRPGAAYCSAIEKATAGKVRRWDLRPDDWLAIWPELAHVEGAPVIPLEQRVANG